jgi:hypothetical protein
VVDGLDSRVQDPSADGDAGCTGSPSGPLPFSRLPIEKVPVSGTSNRGMPRTSDFSSHHLEASPHPPRIVASEVADQRMRARFELHLDAYPTPRSRLIPRPLVRDELDPLVIDIDVRGPEGRELVRGEVSAKNAEGVGIVLDLHHEGHSSGGDRLRISSHRPVGQHDRDVRAPSPTIGLVSRLRFRGVPPLGSSATGSQDQSRAAGRPPQLPIPITSAPPFPIASISAFLSSILGLRRRRRRRPPGPGGCAPPMRRPPARGRIPSCVQTENKEGRRRLGTPRDRLLLRCAGWI